MQHIISLGAGVQSSTMALMAACGELSPMPYAAIFADTQDEPAEVYSHLAWLQSMLPFPVYITTRGKLSEQLLKGNHMARIPFFIKAGGLVKRQCTRNFKIRPIRRKVREILGFSPRSYIAPGSVSQWIGISTDEADRMKPSGVKFIVNRWPLLEDSVMMSREECKRWLWDRFHRSAPKSACKQCPFQDDDHLLHLKETDPAAFTELIAFDARLRSPEMIGHFRGEVFVHSSRVPLVQIDLAGLVANKQRRKSGYLFTNECEGMCGL